MKPKAKKAIIISLLIVLILSFAVLFRVIYVQFCFLGLHMETYGGIHHEAYFPPTPSDRACANGVLKDAEKAFSVVKYCKNDAEKAELKAKYGRLSRYCITHKDDAVSQEHDIDLLAAKISEDSGYMWIMYYQIAFDKDGNISYGSGSKSDKCPARWELEKQNGKWIVVDIFAP